MLQVSFDILLLGMANKNVSAATYMKYRVIWNEMWVLSVTCALPVPALMLRCHSLVHF